VKGHKSVFPADVQRRLDMAGVYAEGGFLFAASRELALGALFLRDHARANARAMGFACFSPGELAEIRAELLKAEATDPVVGLEGGAA
jgi:hypothetical protein